MSITLHHLHSPLAGDLKTTHNNLLNKERATIRNVFCISLICSLLRTWWPPDSSVLSVSKQNPLSQRHLYRMFRYNDRSRTTCGPYPHTISNSPLLESHEPVELAADELLPHFVFLPRQDLEFASDQTSGSRTLLECVRVFAAGNAECDAHVVDVPGEWAHEDAPSVLCRDKLEHFSVMGIRS